MGLEEHLTVICAPATMQSTWTRDTHAFSAPEQESKLPRSSCFSARFPARLSNLGVIIAKLAAGSISRRTGT